MARIAVVGEAMLDVDIEGNASRLSPEAPVPVLDDLIEHDRPGGAALAAVMAARAGHDVVLLTPLADDRAAGRLGELLEEAAVEVIGLPQDGPTPVKRRVRASGQNLIRLDEGGRSRPWERPLATVDQALAAADTVLVSDYGRGLTLDVDCRAALAGAAARVPLVWDPHPRGGDPVGGTLLYTPNLAELHARTGAEAGRSDATVAIASRKAMQLAGTLSCRAVAVTMGGRGALLCFGEGPPQLFATRRVTGDTCGAGDCFAAAVAVSLAEGRLLSHSVQAAVAAATEHVARGGASAFGRDAVEPATDDSDAEAFVTRVRGSGGTVVATGGCFDLLHAGHVAMLESARALGDGLVVCLNSDASVRQLKGEGRPLVPAADRARVLSSLSCVDAVAVFDEDTPISVIERLRPDIWVKGGDYAGRALPEEAVLQAWGGQAVIVPYLEGHSTSELVRAMSTPR
jgi:D-beta-D-heptose 7-phosphate kinase/D-beta-D-heptose 1-phosphate adenosyltransferase